MFTWTAQNQAAPLAIASGSGSKFTTDTGDEWLDFGSLSWQANLGHGHPVIIKAIQEQAARLCMAPPWAVFPEKTELAERLLALAPPGYTKVMFTLGGSEAVENALKIARLFTGRYKTISRYRSYHGASMGALSLTGDYRRPPLEPALPGAIHVLDDIEHMEGVFAHEGPGSIAAVFLEPIPGANGVQVPTEEYWPRVRSLCDAHGALLVADEVLTGFGRTGKAFAVEHFGVVPDLITVAKALTGGYAPLGAVLIHERVASHFDDNTLYAGLTHYAHPLGVCAGLAALNVYRDENLFTKAEVLGEKLIERLQGLASKWPEVLGNARGKGLLTALDVSADTQEGARLRESLRERHLWLPASPMRGTAIFSPPLNIGDADFEDGLGRFEDAMEAAF